MEKIRRIISKTIEELRAYGAYRVTLEGTEDTGIRTSVDSGYGPIVTFDFLIDKIVVGVYLKPEVSEWLSATRTPETELFGLSSNCKFRSPFKIEKAASPFNYQTVIPENVFRALLKKSLTLLKKDARLENDTFSFRPSRDLCDYLGKGEYSSIWRDTKFRAIKVCATNKAWFINEVAILKKYRHRNVIKFLESGNYGGDCAYRMELVDVSLGKYLSWNYKLNPDIADAICEDIAHGVAFLHSHNILHGDLSTNNIGLVLDRTPPGYDVVAKIMDFGTARVLNSRVRTSVHFTTSGFRLPEEEYSNSFAFDPDIWAMGCIFYSCCYGKGYSGISDDTVPPRPSSSTNVRIDQVIWDMCLVPKRSSAAQIVKVWCVNDSYKERYEYSEPVISDDVVEYDSIPLVCEEDLFKKSFV